MGKRRRVPVAEERARNPQGGPPFGYGQDKPQPKKRLLRKAAEYRKRSDTLRYTGRAEASARAGQARPYENVKGRQSGIPQKCPECERRIEPSFRCTQDKPHSKKA